MLEQFPRRHADHPRSDSLGPQFLIDLDAEGDTVVSSASFLIDSESRLKAAIAGMGKQPSMPGMPEMGKAPPPAHPH